MSLIIGENEIRMNLRENEGELLEKMNKTGGLLRTKME
jgi:hypothetical protein